MQGARLVGRSLALGLCVLSCLVFTSANADQEPETLPPHYIVATTTCAVDGDEFALNVILDRELDKKATFGAVESALIRAKGRELDCAKAQVLENKKPALNPPAGEARARALTLVVYSGNIPDAQAKERATFTTEFPGTTPIISIDSSGKWNVWNDLMSKGSKPLKHGPLLMAYYHPQILVSCPLQDNVSGERVASDYLVQVIQFRCDAGARRAVAFFGLGSFASENHSYEGWHELSILGSAYLALEFEVHRAAVSLLE